MRLEGLNSITMQGTAPQKAVIVSLPMLGAVHARDISIILDKKEVVVRAGQHCAGLLMTHLGLTTTCYSLFAVDSTSAEVGVLLNKRKLLRDLFT